MANTEDLLELQNQYSDAFQDPEKIKTPTSKENFVQTFKRLLDVKNNGEPLGDPVTNEAFAAALSWLIYFYAEVEEFPLGYSTESYLGGVTLIWRNKELDRDLRLEIPSEKVANYSLYYRDPDRSMVSLGSDIKHVHTPIQLFLEFCAKPEVVQGCRSGSCDT